MRVVEESSEHLRLSDADSFWGRWGCVVAIVVVILAASSFCAQEVRPTPYFGVASGIILFFILIKGLFQASDKELWFDKPANRLKIIKRLWIGRPQQTDYLLSNITNVRTIKRQRRVRNRSWYPGYEDDIDAYEPTDNATYYIELSVQSGEPLVVYLGDKTKGDAQLATIISEFLGLTPNL